MTSKSEGDMSAGGGGGGGGGGFGIGLVNAVNSIARLLDRNYVSPISTAVVEAKDLGPDEKRSAGGDGVDVGLADVPETMLWTLHNRAGEVAKGNFIDPKCLEIYRAIDYDYERSFGPADESHALRSALFDDLVLAFWRDHPDGSVVIHLGEGLETQRARLEDQRRKCHALWVTVDLPSAVAAREKFLPPDTDHLHLAFSALDVDAWATKIPEAYRRKPTFITAQGLVMYFEPGENAKMFQGLAKHFPGATIVFDSLAKFMSNMTLREGGWKKTQYYTTPRMPTGANRFESEALFKSWVAESDVAFVDWPFHRSSAWFIRYVVPVLTRTPVIRNYQPGMVWAVTFPENSTGGTGGLSNGISPVIDPERS